MLAFFILLHAKQNTPQSSRVGLEHVGNLWDQDLNILCVQIRQIRCSLGVEFSLGGKSIYPFWEFLAVHHLTIFCISRCPQQHDTFKHTEVLWLTENSWKTFEITRNSAIWIFLNLLSPHAEFLASESSSANCQDCLYQVEELFWRMCPANGHEAHIANPLLAEGSLEPSVPVVLPT